MRSGLAVSLSVLLLAGCTIMPTGPNVMALPGANRSFEEFRADDLMCRDYAYQQIGGSAREQEANNAVVGNAVIGTTIGAIAGGALGGRDGAAVGAGMGMLVGSASGAEAARSSTYGSQRHYDIAYVQCMYSKGHRVPVSGTYAPGTTRMLTLPPPPPAAANISPSSINPPPPPAGTPPPPPPSR
jgi:uncharacterized protein YcfJ